MANFEIVYMDGKLDTHDNYRENKIMELCYQIIIFGNGCITDGNDVPFPFVPYASSSPTAFYNVSCNSPLWYVLLFLNGFLYNYVDKFKFHSHSTKLDSVYSVWLSYSPNSLYFDLHAIEHNVCSLLRSHLLTE